MSQLFRGTIAVLVLVIVISVGYLVIQNYEDRKFAEDSKLKQDQMNYRSNMTLIQNLRPRKIK